MSIENSLPTDVVVPAGPITPHHANRLRGDIGVAQLVFTVLSYNAPLGVLAGVAPLVIAFGVGIGAPLLFLALGMLMAFFAVGYTSMSRHLPNPGAFYAYVTAGLGRPLGLGASFVALASYAISMAAFMIFTGLALESLVRDTFAGPDVRWWVWALLFVVAVGVLGYLKVDVSAKVLAVLLTCELAIVLVWDIVVAARGGAHHDLTFGSFDPDVLGQGSIVVGIVFAVTCFGGFEATAVFRDEVRTPERTIPRATYASIAVITLFYTVASWLLVQAFGEDQAIGAIASMPTFAFLASVQTFLGTIGFDIATVLLVTSAFAALVAYHNVVTRYLFSLGADGVLPKSIGTPHPSLGSPHRASGVLTAATLAFVVLVIILPTDAATVYAKLVAITGYAFVLLLVLAAAAIAVYLLRQRPADHTVWHWAVAPVLTAAAMLGIGVLATIKINLLTGSTGLSVIAVAVAFGSILAGVALALVLRTARPAVYARIGRQDGL